MKEIPDSFRDLFDEGQPAQLATVDSDGCPHVTPVFAEYDGEFVLFNTMRGREKERNMRDNSNVGITLLDQDDPYRYLSITGVVEVMTEQGAIEHVHHIARTFMDMDQYPFLDDEPNARVIVKIRPEVIRAVKESERED